MEHTYDLDAVHEFEAEFEGTPSTGHWTCPHCDSEKWHNCEPCPDCGTNPEDYGEPSFSWSPCDCCGSHLGGDRYDVIGWFKGARAGGYTDEFQWSGHICPDCLRYLANGDLPGKGES